MYYPMVKQYVAKCSMISSCEQKKEQNSFGLKQSPSIFDRLFINFQLSETFEIQISICSSINYSSLDVR
ncbi:unnamed protein product [Adineta ricciae]|uniref:Uncharacterized protein n=1 Tax=Adineta ricciae TaxID=249248 RepID=A0A813VGA4_ADIRI|nr:unnamed protein product [Adineta ricciae]